jgi:hypothetical protein
MTHRRFLCLAVVLLASSMACAPRRVGPTVPSGYIFTLVAPSQVFRGTAEDVIVRVQDAQGNPVDGVPVEFRVEPKWAADASLTPRVLTRGGIARSIFQADIIGLVQITAQVEQTALTTTIVVISRGTPSAQTQRKWRLAFSMYLRSNNAPTTV